MPAQAIAINDGVKNTTPRGSISFPLTKLKVPDNVTVAGFEPRLTFTVTGAAADSDGMSSAAQTALLQSVHVTFQAGAAEGMDPLTPIDNETIKDLSDDALRTLNRSPVGGVGDTTGLAKAIAQSTTNSLTAVLPFSIAGMKDIEEDHLCGAMSAKQLEDCTLTFTFDSEPLHGIDSNVTLTAITLDLRVIPGDVPEGEPEVIPTCVVTVKGNDENHITTPVGLVNSVEDTNAALSGTAIQVITVTAGQFGTISADPAVPADVQAALDRAPNASAAEVSLKTVRTPLYLSSPTPIGKAVVGPITAKMRSHYVNLQGRVIYKPLLSHDQVWSRIKRRASKLEGDQFVHAISTHMVEEYTNNLEEMPYEGWQYFFQGEPRFSGLPGIRCKKGGEPFIYMPTNFLIRAMAEYGAALADKTVDEGNNPMNARLAVLGRYGHYFPGFITSATLFSTGGLSRVGTMLSDYIVNGSAELARRGVKL